MKLLPFLLSPLSLWAFQPLDITLPTDNRALFDDRPEDYYMYVVRYIDGKPTKPWTAGQYGFVRNLVPTLTEGTIATRFHEGLDVKPTRRDRNNNALDEIRSIADGKVVYVNDKADASNYGKYLVVEHHWGYGPIYSLYAHLSKTSVKADQPVKKGTVLGIMGHTGSGLNRARAHLHVELALRLSDNFEDWSGVGNGHRNYDGRNLTGIDIASLLVAVNNGVKITIPDFLKSASPYYKVAFPRTEELQLTQRYPWLKRGRHESPSRSWEIAFTDSGIPLAVRPSHRLTTKPTVTYVRPTRSEHRFYTRDRLTGTAQKATLTKSGRRYLQLFTNELAKPAVEKPSQPESPNDN